MPRNTAVREMSARTRALAFILMKARLTCYEACSFPKFNHGPLLLMGIAERRSGLRMRCDPNLVIARVDLPFSIALRETENFIR